MRAWVICSNEKGCIFAYRPHPNPLPEGEGTSDAYFSDSLLESISLRPIYCLPAIAHLYWNR